MTMNTGNVESSLLLFIVQVEFCYKLHKLHICRAAGVPFSRVVFSMKSVLHVRDYTEHIALYM